MPFLEIDLSGASAAASRSEKVRERLSDLRPVWPFVHDLLRAEMRRQFESEGRYLNGEPWAPLSPEYAAWKLDVYGPMPILQRERRLFYSLTNEDHEDHVFESDREMMVYGTTVEYARRHQVGEGNLPQRKILSITDAHRRIIFRAMMIYALTGNVPPAQGEAFDG